MIDELLHRVHARVGDLRLVQPLDDLSRRQLRKDLADQRVERIAMLDPSPVGGETLVEYDLRPPQHDLTELRPLPLVLHRQVDRAAITSRERAVRRDRGVAGAVAARLTAAVGG